MKREFTLPLESATRKVIDETLRNLKWKTNEFGKECNVFTERPRTHEERGRINKKFPKGKFPDYVLYSSEQFKPIAIIEAKKSGENLEKALKQAKEYAECLDVKIIFAIDGAIIEARDIRNGQPLKLEDILVTQLISEDKILKFIKEGSEIFAPRDITNTKQELMEIFATANVLLREEGMREGVERFTEFSNLLFLKLIDEMETDREKNGEKRRLEKRYCWNSFKDKEGQDIIDYINEIVLPKLIGKYNGSGDVFQERLKIKNPEIIKKIVDQLSKLRLSNTDSDIKGDAFEYFLKNSISVGNDLGEYFTPRHIVKLIVDLINPQYGEKVYDPCCGTGGFLIEAFKHIKSKCKLTKEVIKVLENDTVYGRELTGTAKIAKMNMILAGDGHTHIQEMDSLSEPIHNKFDVILANYPFAQNSKYGHLYGLNTSEANPIFLKHIIDALKEGGRAGVVVPDGVLFGKGKDYIKVRKILTETCNIKAIIQLDTAVFMPYTQQPTSIIIFEKTPQTKKIWFFEIFKDGFKKTTSKKGRPSIIENDLPKLRTMWNDKEESKQSFFIDFDKIKESNYKLFMNYYKPRKEIKNKKELGEICSNFIIGGTPPKKDRSFYGNDCLWANISDIKGKYISKTSIKLSEKGMNRLKSKLIRKGTVITSFKLTLGKTAIAGEDLITNEAICGLIPKDKTDETFNEYMYYMLPLLDYTPYAQRASMGLTLNKGLLPTVEIPFPPKEERKLIIKRLKRLREDIEKEKEKMTEEINKKENYLKEYVCEII